ncbi:MAG: hypothetical protein JWP47_2982 [Polaromonas sp.]|nr:hypothetical protein [Polaromonas sp.]
MADIHIERQHGMSLAQARKAAFQWAEQAEQKFDMECTYEEGADCDAVSFKRSGVTGTLTVDAKTFELQAKLGFLLGAFREKIEGEIVKNLDALIAGHPAHKAHKTAAKAAEKPAAKKTPRKSKPAA